MIRYMDTSAFVKYYGKPKMEKGAEIIESIFDDARKGRGILLSSIFMLGEMISVFDGWVRIKAIDSDDFEKITGRFVLDLKEMSEGKALILETIDPMFIPFSTEFIIKHHLSINDAIHLYTALLWKQKLDD
jgi:predicted nucleic acid-binding protein